MKIDEACINHNVVLLVDGLSSWIKESTDVNTDGYEAIMSLVEIAGVIDLADNLKKVLKE